MMKKMFLLTIFVFCIQSVVYSLDAVTFDDKGLAEVSSYRVVQPRYGELRYGKMVMVFVTEDMNKETRIKVEDYRIPQSNYVKVLKLIRNLSFNTGVYDYQIQTSSFSTIEQSKEFPVFYPMKISIGAHEWCGNFYAHLLPQKDAVDFVMHSYFDGEGDQESKINFPADAVFEDTVWVLIRELNGQWMPIGEKQKLIVMPSLWQSRLNHKTLEFENGWIEKSEGEEILFQGKAVKTIKWTYTVEDRQMTIWVQDGDGNRILSWKGSEGERGTIIDSFDLDYWRNNSNKDLYLREKLGLQ